MERQEEATNTTTNGHNKHKKHTKTTSATTKTTNTTRTTTHNPKKGQHTERREETLENAGGQARAHTHTNKHTHTARECGEVGLVERMEAWMLMRRSISRASRSPASASRRRSSFSSRVENCRGSSMRFPAKFSDCAGEMGERESDDTPALSAPGPARLRSPAPFA